MNEKAPDTIMATLRKIRALAQDASAPEGEREAAMNRLHALLKKHGLTLEQLESPARGWCFFTVPPKGPPWGLLTRCYYYVMQVNTLTYKMPDSKRGVWIELTLAEEADLRSCFAHYLPMLRAEIAKVEKHRKAVLKELKALQGDLADAIAIKYGLHGPPSDEEPAAPMDAAAMARILAVMRGMQRVEPWKRDVPRLNEGEWRLTA